MYVFISSANSKLKKYNIPVEAYINHLETIIVPHSGPLAGFRFGATRRGSGAGIDASPPSGVQGQIASGGGLAAKPAL